MTTDLLTLNESQTFDQRTLDNQGTLPAFLAGSTPTFFYIGSSKNNIQIFSRFFEAGFMAENFWGAKNILLTFEFKNAVIPDVILVDVPYNKEQLRELTTIIRSSKYLSSTPILYNQKFIEQDIYNDPGCRGLFDDVVDLGYPGCDLFVKVSFLKKFKAYENLTNFTNPGERKGMIGHTRLGIHLDYKRVLDIVLSSLLILLLSPLFLLIAIAIKLESKGPVLYNSLRAGKGYRVFRFYKFRTMRVGAENMIDEALVNRNKYKGGDLEDGPMFFKVDKDPRATPLGSFLRDCSLDELPQLFNVLKGDMSLVGNRPLPLNEAATLTTNDYVERFQAPAGITGLWQIKKRGKPEMSITERAKLDTIYARKRSFLYDLWILMNTPPAIFQKSIH